MKYALGNMLNGAGGLNADQLALDLQFAADKTLTARKGPTPVFTRGSAATLVNSSGLIQYAPEMQFLQSDNFASASWQITNATISSNVATSPDGQTTADKLIVNSGASIGRAAQTFTLSGANTMSVFAKASEWGWVFISPLQTNGGVWFNLSNGTIGTQNSNFVGSITSFGNGWYRCSVSFTGLGTPLTARIVATNADNVTSIGDGTSGILIWGAQLEAGPLKSYNPTTTSAFYGPRFDHDPVTLASRGLLIEESRTNVFLHSEDLTQASWGKNGATISANATTAPDGTTTADGIVDDTTTASHRVVQSLNATAGITYTVSCFIKRNQVTDFFQIAFASANFGTNSTWFNISNGTIVSSTGNASPSTITALPNGWYRVTHTVTCTVSSTVANVFLNPSTNSTTINYTGTGVLTVFFWGAQVEAGSFATSYIPTTTASVVRSAEVCSISGAAFTSFWNRFAGTAIIGVGSSLANSGRFISNTAAARALEIYSGTPSTNIDFFEASGTQEIRIVTLAAFPIKVGLAYAINDYQSSYNGLLGGSDTNTGGTIPDATAFYIGTLGGSSNRMTGHIQFIRYYKKRLPNAKLQALTV